MIENDEIYKEYTRQYVREWRKRRYRENENYRRRAIIDTERVRQKKKGVDYYCFYIPAAEVQQVICQISKDILMSELIRVTRINDEYKLQIYKKKKH